MQTPREFFGGNTSQVLGDLAFRKRFELSATEAHHLWIGHISIGLDPIYKVVVFPIFRIFAGK